MALESLTAKANVGAGTDALAVVDTGSGKAGAVALVNDAGVLVDSGNPLPVEIQGSIPVTIASAIEITNDAGNAIPVSAAALPLPAGAATEVTLASVNSELNLIEGYFKAEDDPAVSGDKGIPLLAMRQLADTTSTSNDGDYTLIKIDEEGRVKVATKPASFALVTGNITANAQTVFCDVSRASNVQIHMVATTLVGHNATFEGSLDSTNGTDGAWFAIQVVRSNANTIELTTGVLAATPAYAWEASVNGLTFVRVRATAHTSGTATWKFQRGSYATEPIPAAQVSAAQAVTLTSTTISSGTVSPLTVAGASALASAARTTTGASGALTNASGRNAHFFLNVSAASGTTPNLAVRIQVQDPVSLAFIDLPTAAFTAVTTTGLSLLTVTNLPRTYQIAWTITGTTPSFTFSVGIAPVI